MESPAPLSALSPQTAWQPLPDTEWNEGAARHLLQRIGFSCTAPELARALKDGLEPTLRRHFASMPALPEPARVATLRADAAKLVRQDRGLTPEARRAALRDAREQSREALQDLILAWLDLAARPENSAAEKWLLFLSDVWVVSVEKVKNSALIYQHQDILRRHALGKAPDLAKAASRSPAMIVYLDLQQSGRAAPNENFARELFELFTLGEGHYSESDIKQAARAFTGYRQRAGEFQLTRRQHDDGVKIIFGQRGNFSGDDVIDLIFRQRAAASFLPGEMIRFYLSDSPLPADWVASLGAHWAASGFDLRELALTFFRSRAFFAADFRGDFIKSPVQFYLGLLQDLDLQVAPLPRYVLGALRQMGQMPFDPPNVRGWIGGRSWINSATLAVRRQVIHGLLQPFDGKILNGDELAALARAGRGRFTLDAATLETWGELPPDELTNQLLARVHCGQSGAELRPVLDAFLRRGGSRAETVRAALAALLESPSYQLS